MGQVPDTNTAMNVDRAVRQVLNVSHTVDPTTRLPLAVVDSTALPTPGDPHYPELVQAILNQLPKSNYVLLFFACGAPNKPSWSWAAKIYAMLDRATKKRIQKIYVVHESWWVRAVSEMLRGVVSSKFKRKLVHVSSLSQLAQHVDITRINIRPQVYLHNLKVEDRITVPRHSDPVFGGAVPFNGSFHMPLVWHDCLQYLGPTAPNTRGIFTRTDQVQVLTILRDAYDRSQLLDLDDYGPHMAASVLSLYLYELSTPVVPVECIRLPVEDSGVYCASVVATLPPLSQHILSDLVPLLRSIVQSSDRTGHSASSLSVCLGRSIIGLSSVTREGIKIGERFTRILIEHWPHVRAQMDEAMRQVSDNQAQSPFIEVRKRAAAAASDSASASATTITTPRASPAKPSKPFYHSPSPSHIANVASARNKSTPDLLSHQAMVRTPTDPFVDTDDKKEERKSSAPNLTVNPINVASVATPMASPAKSLRAQKSQHSLIGVTAYPVMGPPPSVDLDPAQDSPRKVKSTGRGKVVAELAKLYEERSDMVQVLMEVDNS